MGILSNTKFRRFSLPQHPQGVFLCLAILALAMRFPYFFEAVINWDESTFILLGQSVVDGNLPYTELLDVKPPLLWICFALFILVFGKTVVSIRLAGSVCVVLTAFFTYLIGRKIWDNNIGVISAILFIIVTGLSPEGEAVMSEHVALVPLMAGLSLLIEKKNTLWTIFFASVLITTASLIRLNLAYIALAVGLVLLFCPPNNFNREVKLKLIIYRGIAYALGGVSVVFLTMIPYLILRQEQIWFSGVITASLSYSSVQKNLFATLSEEITAIWNILLGRTSTALIGVAILVWVGGMFQVFLTLIHWKRLDNFKQKSIILLLATLLSLEFSVLKGGFFYSHYLIQFNAIISLFAAVLIKKALLSSQYQRVVITFIILAFFIAFIHVSLKYVRLGDEIVYNHRILYGPAYQIAELLEQENTNRQPVLLLSSHLAYWLTNSKPLTPTMTHPSNLNKEFLLKAWLGEDASTATELSKILRQQPKFIIGEQLDSFFKKDTVQEEFNRTIYEHYIFVKKIDAEKVYKRSR